MPDSFDLSKLPDYILDDVRANPHKYIVKEKKVKMIQHKDSKKAETKQALKDKIKQLLKIRLGGS